MDFLEACRKFIAIDSTPGNGNLELALFAAQLCRDAGLTVEVQQETHNGLDQANVIARPMSEVPPRELMLQTHLDTVDPGPYALWTKTESNPFNASIYQDTLYGLGAADVKLDFLCKLKALEAFKDAQWRLPPVLVGTYGEELGMAGAIKLFRKKKVAAQAALVGEPSEMRLIHAGKGIAVVEIEIPFSQEERDYKIRHNQGESTSSQSRMFIGKAAHSSMPHHGDSAIIKMFDYLLKLPEGLAVMEMEGGVSYNTVPAHAVLEIDAVGALRDTIGPKIAAIIAAIRDVEVDFLNYPEAGFMPPHPTLNIGMIRTYEEFVKMSGCCRLPPSVSHEVYECWMQRLRLACESVGAVFRITDYKQPFSTEPTSQIIQICQGELTRLGLDSSCTTQSASNEANVFSRFGIETVVFGPGQGVGNSHAPNEHISIEQLLKAIEFYRGVIERVCL